MYSIIINPSTLYKMSYINTAFRLVIELSRQYNIDESHALKHSMEVYGYAKKIMKTELGH